MKLLAIILSLGAISTALPTRRSGDVFDPNPSAPVCYPPGAKLDIEAVRALPLMLEQYCFTRMAWEASQGQSIDDWRDARICYDGDPGPESAQGCNGRLVEKNNVRLSFYSNVRCYLSCRELETPLHDLVNACGEHGGDSIVWGGGWGNCMIRISRDWHTPPIIDTTDSKAA